MAKFFCRKKPCSLKIPNYIANLFWTQVLPDVVEIDVEVPNPSKAIRQENRASKQANDRGDPNAQLIAIWGVKKEGIWSCKDSASGTIGAAWVGGVCIPATRMFALHYQMTETGAFWMCKHTPLIKKSAGVSLVNK